MNLLVVILSVLDNFEHFATQWFSKL